ncbi:hypothetical protein [Dethiosulfatarculus sandiegensis]|uniref:Uncharacterized protein n=1 Tax=Dethiosulfatarculus sandiegensis TaxID=1429043 RepID=A0A0D2GLC2_9BACT|nr:hypothetical protein [Dethiosulfatarculus sandiegensis]KIX15467.1 hypothetical protein X474_04220 [Dethiosulfatarculus sandiegensis]
MIVKLLGYIGRCLPKKCLPGAVSQPFFDDNRQRFYWKSAFRKVVLKKECRIVFGWSAFTWFFFAKKAS